MISKKGLDSKIDGLQKKLQGMVPDRTFYRVSLEESKLFGRKNKINSMVELEFSLSESFCPRDQAMELYEKIRLEIPDIIESEFHEVQEMEWDFKLQFKILLGGRRDANQN